MLIEGDEGIKKSTDPANNLPKIMISNLPAYYLDIQLDQK
jgi:hypothetical protein